MFSPELITAFLTLTFLEIVLGIDNIIFISILSGRFPENKRNRLMRYGLFLAMFMRILLLLGISWLVKMQKPFFEVHSTHFSTAVSLQGLVLFLGGIFLIYKSTKEIYHKVEKKEEEKQELEAANTTLFSKVLLQIALIDIVFSFDSILTAVGMTNGLKYAIWIMIAAIIVSIIIMMSFSVPINKFVNKHPSVQILGLSFLLLIGFMLIAEAAHLSEAVILGSSIGSVPKGYLYFAIAFSLGVEFLNMRIRKKS